MYFRWKDRRIVVKIAVWAADEGRAAPFVHALADAVAERVDAGELDPPEPSGSVGLPRNGEALAVDEPDRTFTMLLCHPSGTEGRFGETPVDYKLVAPEAPVADNRAFDSALHDASGILFLASGEETADAGALEALSNRLASTGESPTVACRTLLSPRGTDRPEPEDFERAHDLPGRSVVESARVWNGDEAWEAFLGLAGQIRPLLEDASDRGVLPV